MNGTGELTVATTSSRLNVLEALNSKYTCLFEPGARSDNNNNGRRRYLTSLRVYGNRDVEDEPLVSSETYIHRVWIMYYRNTYKLKKIILHRPHLNDTQHPMRDRVFPFVKAIRANWFITFGRQSLFLP
ncbi:PB1 domain, RWP-RK domain protein [Artemisia annua]|uniref:PB1 domain, RWP-RK domain protein n=1 Tax=Artemisia annua TaxID=35608 RepID=A0A2U1MNU8_ARTAN|nr:PB1 domain, RWP-RK domain protein [Artemisia annua]